jgi:hypothetical protein
MVKRVKTAIMQLLMASLICNPNKRCKKDRADMLKNPVKAKGIYYNTHDCKSYSKCVFDRGWLAMQKVSKETLDGLFHHICPINNSNLMQLVSNVFCFEL